MLPCADIRQYGRVRVRAGSHIKPVTCATAEAFGLAERRTTSATRIPSVWAVALAPAGSSAFSVLYTTSVTSVVCSLVRVVWTLTRVAWTRTRIIGTVVRIISAANCSAGSLTAFRTGAKLNGGGIVELDYQRNRSAPEQGAQARVLVEQASKVGAEGWLVGSAIGTTGRVGNRAG